MRVDIPGSLHRKLKERAAAQGRSVGDLILASIRVSFPRRARSRGKKVHFPVIFSKGPKVDLTNEQIYERLEFPDGNASLYSLPMQEANEKSREDGIRYNFGAGEWSKIWCPKEDSNLHSLARTSS